MPDFELPEHSSWAACEALLLVRSSLRRFGLAENCGCALLKVLARNRNRNGNSLPFPVTALLTGTPGVSHDSDAIGLIETESGREGERPFEQCDVFLRVYLFSLK